MDKLIISGNEKYHFKEDRKKIGQGGFGKVYKAVWLKPDNTELTVAVKALFKESKVDEASILREMRHRNVILCYAVFKGPSIFSDNNDTTHLLLEFAAHGDLHTLLEKEHPPCDELYEWMIDIARGMNYFHNDLPRDTRIHCDLKTPNILIADHVDRRIAKIADFGLSVKSSKPSNLIRNHLGTFHYMAPEVCRDEGWSKKGDVWSYGIVVCEILMECLPYSEICCNGVAVFFHVASTGKAPTLDPDIPEFFQDLINRCCKSNCDDRPNIEDVLNVYPGSYNIEAKQRIIEDLSEYKQKLWNKPKVQPASRTSTANDRCALSSLLAYKLDVVDDGVKNKLADKIQSIEFTDKMIQLCKEHLEGDIPTVELNTITDSKSLVALLENYGCLSLENLDVVKGLFHELEIEDPKLNFLIEKTLEIVPSTVKCYEKFFCQEPIVAGYDQLNQLQMAYTNEDEDKILLQDKIFQDLAGEFDNLAKNISNDWRRFARHLGISNAAVYNVDEQSGRLSTYDCVMKCFRFWTENLIENKTDLSRKSLIDILLKALSNSRLTYLAKSLSDPVKDGN